MLLNKRIQILVFHLSDDGDFDNLGEINQFESLMWADKYNGYSSFELWAPITQENSELLKVGNILWCGGDNAAMIEVVKSTVDDDNTMTYNVKGRTLEMLLTTRIVWGTHNIINKDVSTAIYEFVNQNCVNPTDAKRKIPFLECDVDANIGGKITVQKTGGDVYDIVHSIAKEAGIGFSVLFRPKEKRLIFTVFEGMDKTINQNVNDPIEFSTDLEDILSSSYYINNQDKRTVALVLGEVSGVTRKSQVAGDSDGVGFSRRELYVDARDLQTETTSEGGQQQPLTPQQYADALMARGEMKLSECLTVETFEAQLRVLGEVQYQFGVDYKKGDKVTVRDDLLNVLVSAVITEVEEDFSDEYNLTLTFGYSYPTVLQKIRQEIN